MTMLYIDARLELSKFFNKSNNVLIIGALDGFAHDNISPFVIPNTDWSTIFVEPVKEYFDKLVKNFPKRDNIFFENAAITEENSKRTIYKVNSSFIKTHNVPNWCDGISTFYKDNHVLSSISEEYLTTEEVQTISIECLCNKYKITNIDILQIDTEGYDYFILDQIFKHGLAPKYIYIEIVHMNHSDLDSLKSTLYENNYRIFLDKNNSDNLVAIKKYTSINHHSFNNKKRRFAFYIHTEWALGAIHKELLKELFKRDINCDIIDWSVLYSQEVFKSFDDIYDCFISTTNGGASLINNFGIHPSKIIGINHGRSDIQSAIDCGLDFDAIKQYAGISKDLYSFSKQLGISRDMIVLQNGVSFDQFYRPPSKELKTIGHIGAPHREWLWPKQNIEIKDWKRGHLVEKISKVTETPLLVYREKPHLSTPEYYRNIDTVIIPSTEIESCGLPLMESACAGRLPISARVGITTQFDHPPGIILPIDENEFVESCVSIINHLKRDTATFSQLCQNAQDFAREYYDWSYVIDDWINLITN